jgi:NTE family protein
MKSRLALVLSGGGMFGAWQAGAWRALAQHVQPDLIVGASVGSVNGYIIASGATPDELIELWRRPDFGDLNRLPENLDLLVKHYTPLTEYAVVVTDALRAKPKIFQGPHITWRHLAASCAIPMVLRPYKIDGRWYNDGGVLNPLPVWAAVELGATHVVALHAIPEVPSLFLEPFAKGFRWVLGHHPPLPPGVELTIFKPERTLGTIYGALHWKRKNIEHWLELGFADASRIHAQSLDAR